LKIPSFTDAPSAALAIEAYLRQVLKETPYSSYKFREVPAKNFDSSKLHFSEIASECPRKALLSVNTENSFKGNGFTLAGEHYEKLVVAALDLYHEGEFDGQASISSIPPETQAHVDLIWTNKKVVIEIKSIGIAARKVTTYPLVSHYNQLGGYVGYKEKETGEEWIGILIYIFRENPMLVDVFPLPSKYKKESVFRVEETVNNYKNGYIPLIPLHFDPTSFPCSWYSKDNEASLCNHFETCWGKDPVKNSEPVKLLDWEKQQKANKLEKLLEQKELLAIEVKQLNANIKKLEKELKSEFDDCPTVTGTDTNLRRVEKKARKSYDLQLLLKKGLISDNLLALCERNVAGSSYVRRVKKGGENNGEEEVEGSEEESTY